MPKIQLSESELRNIVRDAINEQLVNEGFFDGLKGAGKHLVNKGKEMYREKVKGEKSPNLMKGERNVNLSNAFYNNDAAGDLLKINKLLTKHRNYLKNMGVDSVDEFNSQLSGLVDQLKRGGKHSQRDEHGRLGKFKDMDYKNNNYSAPGEDNGMTGNSGNSDVSYSIRRIKSYLK